MPRDQFLQAPRGVYVAVPAYAYTRGMPRLLELDLEFKDIRPRIWRRVRVPADLKLAELHHVIQVVMDWADYHLHLFEVAGREYGPRPEEEWEREHWSGDDASISVSQALSQGNGGITYVYDFGDEWRVDIKAVADTVAPEPVQIECLAGELAAPPEDSGGPVAYTNLLSTGKPNGRRKDYDRMSFDLVATNERLHTEISKPETTAIAEAQVAASEERLLADLTLLVLYLASWEEGHGFRVSGKTIRVDTLDALTEAGLIATTAARKSLILTDEGVHRAQALRARVAELLAAPRV